MANPNMIVGGPPVNPKGRPAGVFHTLSDTRSRFLETLTRAEICAIAASDEKLNNYTAWQAQVLIGLAESLQRTPDDKLDPSKERERLYDREIGKPAQTLALEGGDPNKPILMSRHYNEADIQALRRYFENPAQIEQSSDNALDKTE